MKTLFSLLHTQEPTLLHIVSQMNPLNMSPLKQVTLPLSLRICLQISGHPTKTVYRFVTFPTDVTCPPHVITLNFIILKKMACRSEWPRGLRHGSVASRLLGLWVRVPPEAWNSISCVCCVLWCRGLCVGLITRPEESH